MRNTTEILSLTDEIEIIEAIGTKIWNKKQNDESLTDEETNFILIDIFEGNINEGGFLYFFNNEMGDYAREIMEAYKKIGAPKQQTLLQKQLVYSESIIFMMN